MQSALYPWFAVWVLHIHYFLEEMRGLPNKQHISDISHLDLTICICINVFQLTKPRKYTLFQNGGQ